MSSLAKYVNTAGKVGMWHEPNVGKLYRLLVWHRVLIYCVSKL